MRLHRLTVRAFGPFAEQQSVDFDALADSGIFLLHGPTGAGKTSLLDAVCFALYGRVPGPRGAGSRLRSDHANPATGPQVSCEFTASERRFEVVRSPAWERPKKRGEGITLENAKVELREWVDGAWLPRTQRIDEAALLLDDVLQLKLEHFTKLVLLPQGDFASFLRADAEDRRQLLERLFDTDRFSAVQQWLREHQLALRHHVEAAQAQTRDLLARAEQAAHGLGAEPAGDGQDAGERVEALHAVAVAARNEALSSRVLTHTMLAGLRRKLTEAVTLQRLQTEHTHVRDDAQRLAATAAVHADRRTRLRAADRAAALVGVVPLLRAATERERHTCSRLDLLLATAGELADLDDDTLAAAMVTVREQIGKVAGSAADEPVLAELERNAARRPAIISEAVAAIDGAAERVQATRAQLDDLTARLAGAQAIAATLDAAVDLVDSTDRIVQAVSAEQQLRTLLSQAQRDVEQAREGRDDARSHWLDLREGRLEGIAAEIASQLIRGDPCPVCGGEEHPRLAQPAGAVVTDADERRAKHQLDEAERRLSYAQGQTQELTARHAAARATAENHDLDGAHARAADAAQACEIVRRSAAAAITLSMQRPDVESQLHAAVEHEAAARSRLQTLENDQAREQAALTGLRDRVLPARGHHPSVARHLRQLRESAALGERLLAARAENAQARAALGEITDTAQTLAADAGFADLAGGVQAILPEQERADLERCSENYEREWSAVHARLEHPELVAAAERPAAEVAPLAAELVVAEADDENSAKATGLCQQAVDSLDRLAGDLSRHLHRSAPLIERHRVVNELFRCAEGTGGDNTLRMSLSAYVLAARLEQVAQAATERLGQMSGGRYALVHTDAADKGRSRSGLGLQIVDGWTGQRRDTASLSGGETFYTSLALALGLADVVSADAGGIRIETLFVDEGFGTLDEETLEEVMDTIDGLRAGGRAVGLVSHVADLRHRIPARVEVIKGQTGSSLKQSVAS